MRVAKKFLVMILAVVMSMGLTVMGYAANGNDATRGTYSPKKDFVFVLDSVTGNSEEVYEGGSIMVIPTPSSMGLGGIAYGTGSNWAYEGDGPKVKEDKKIKVYLNGEYQFTDRGRNVYVTWDGVPAGASFQFKYKKGRIDIIYNEPVSNEDLLAQYYAALEKQQNANGGAVTMSAGSID